MFGISMWELLLVGLVLFLVVGPSKLPGLAKQLGQGIKDLRRSLNDIKGSVDQNDEFVKAVRSAKQSVAEAKEVVRSIFDEDEDDFTKAPEESEVDEPAVRTRAPGGRRMVKPAQGELEEGPVEEEVWKRPALAEAEHDGDATGTERAQAPDAPEAKAAPPAEPEQEPASEADAVPPEAEPTPPRRKPGRRLVRPAKTPDQGEGD